MDNVRTILTPSAIWGDFNGQLPLKESKISEMTYDRITYTEVYFSGRETESARVRIYGLYARPNTLPAGKKLGAVLVLPDFYDTVDLETVNHFAKQGYAVLMVDYRGETKETTNHTNYPSEIDYANFMGAEDVFRVDRTAKQTCWYEWSAVAKYAISYLRARPEVDKIGIVGIKQGANVGWQALFGEDRVSCFVPMFGIGWQAYLDVPKFDGSDIEMSDERYRWLSGVDAHVYAQHVKCPVFYVAGTNSSRFSCDRGVDTLTRMPPEVESHFNFAPRLRGVINKKCADDVSLFLKKHLARDGVNTEKLYFPKQPDLMLAPGKEDGNIFAEVVASETEKIKSIAVYCSEGTAEPSKRNWCLMQPAIKEKGEISKTIFKMALNCGSELVTAFAVVEYKNGVTLSSRIVHKKIEKKPTNVSKMLYSSKNGVDGFTIYDEKKNAVGGVFFEENSGIELVHCANGIAGISSRYGLLTYKIGESRFKYDANSIIKFDVYCEEYTRLNVSLMLDDGKGEFTAYSTVVTLKGSRVWQNVQAQFSEFKSESRMGIKDYSKIVALKIDAESRFAINNLLLI